MKPRAEIEIKRMPIAETRKYAVDLTETYDSIVNDSIRKRKYLLCHRCGKYKTFESFYVHPDNVTGKAPYCKSCCQALVEQSLDGKSDMKETKEGVKTVLFLLDAPFLNDLYDSCVKAATNPDRPNGKTSPFSYYISMIRSLDQYKGLRWRDSQFGDGEEKSAEVISEETKANMRKLKAARKRFGNMPDEDLLFLENEYEDWVGRYICQTKADEALFEMLCLNRLDAAKARRASKPTKDLDKSFQEMLSTLNISPKQNTGDVVSDAQTFGTLIKKWEDTRPIPEPDEDFKDVDNIGLYIDSFYRGHMSKMLGLNNTFADLYEKVMSKYTVRPQSYNPEEDDNEALFNQIFSNVNEY